MNETKTVSPGLRKTVFLRFGLGAIILPLVLCLTAGTLAYWQAWVYTALLFIPMGFVMAYLFKNAPDLLERRMRTREKESEQNLIIKTSVIFYLGAFFLPGFDFRFGWSQVPVSLVILAEVFVFAGYMYVFSVFRENQYASRVVEVEEEQKVISTGPYALVRHPMYLGMLVMFLFTPIALGSYWALIPAAFILPTTFFRIVNEEKVLERELNGYKDYKAKVKSRLIPGIW